MKFLMSHGEKLVCAVVVVLCGVWIFMSLVHDTSSKQVEIKNAQEQIRQALENNRVDASWKYHEANLVDYDGAIKGYVESAEQPVAAPSQAYAFYPQPDRPVVEEKKIETPTTVTEQATLSKFTGLKVDEQQGMIALTCQMPGKIPNFVPVRIELQRGTSPDKLDKTIHVFELGPEVGTVGVADTAKKPAAEENEDAGQEKTGTTARSARRASRTTTKKNDAPTRAAPAPTSLKFEDTTVDAKVTYYYRARLVARLETLGPNNVIFRDGKEVTILVPDNIEKIPGKIEGTTLYASPWSAVEKGTVPANFQLRFNFVTGTVPTDPRAPQVGYGVFLGVRLWDTEARAWSEGSFEVQAGKPIAGKQKFKVGATTKMREFDTGLVLESVRQATKFEVEKVKELLTENKTDENGETVAVPVVDETGQPKWVEKLVPRRTPTQIVILKVGDTDKEIRLVKGQGYDTELPEDVKILLDGEPEPAIQPTKEAPKAPAAAGDAKAPAATTKTTATPPAAPTPAATPDTKKAAEKAGTTARTTKSEAPTK